jgi:hypothetical protein
MQPKKLINALKNIDQVVEGVKNSIFKTEHVELIANERWKKCKGCELVDLDGKNCAAPGTQPCCGECGCSLGFKLRALSASCPHPEGPKWDAVMTEAEEDKFNSHGE